MIGLPIGVAARAWQLGGGSGLLFDVDSRA